MTSNLDDYLVHRQPFNTYSRSSSDDQFMIERKTVLEPIRESNEYQVLPLSQPLDRMNTLRQLEEMENTGKLKAAEEIKIQSEVVAVTEQAPEDEESKELLENPANENDDEV